MDTVLQYAQRFLPHWDLNCKKLHFEAARLLIEGLSICGWDRRTYYDTEFMKRLGKFIDLDMLRKEDKLQMVNWHVNTSTNQETMDPPTKRRRIDCTPSLPPSTSYSTEYPLESSSSENVESSTPMTDSEPTSTATGEEFSSQWPDGNENSSLNNVSTVSPTHREPCVSQNPDVTNMCNTQFPEGGCLPSEVYGLQDISVINYDYNALLDGDNVSRLINNPTLRDISVIDYDYNALLDGDNVSRLINNQNLQDVDVHYVNPLWNHNFSISQSSRGHR